MDTDKRDLRKLALVVKRPRGAARKAALKAARAAIEEAGVPSFTLREIADQIGVVHSALYRHFPSRADLLAAVAEEGFTTLLGDLNSVRLQGGHGSVDRLKRLCRAHLDFALGNGPLYKVMFGPEVVPFDVEGTELYATASAVMSIALEAVADCQLAGALGGSEPLGPGLVFWSSLHGLAMLAIDGRLEPKLDADRTVHWLLDLSINALLRGL